MVLDASAIVAILLREPGWERLMDEITQASVVLVGAPTLFESALVLSNRYRRDARMMVHEFLRRADADVVPFAADHYEAALDLWLRFGKGRHAAGLNFGDCLAGSVAVLSGQPLLYTGEDFAKAGL